MKTIIAAIALAVFAYAPAALAEEVTYVAKVSGITCGGCQASITSAFKKLSGVTSVTFKDSKKLGVKKATVVTDGSAAITKEQVVESLGDMASRYTVENWAESGKSKS